jgi:putative transcriptional regulator
MIDNNLSTILGKKLINISTVSKATGISRSTLTSLYYRRSKGISFDVLGKLCEYLDCEVNDLFKYRKKTEPRCGTD